MPDQGMFEPPFDSRWTIIQFEDCYLLVARGRLPYSPKQYFILPSVIRYLVTILPKSLALSKLENPTMQLATKELMVPDLRRTQFFQMAKYRLTLL